MEGSEEFFELAREAMASLENVPTPAALVDGEGTIRWQNETSIALRGSRIGHSFIEFVARADKEQAQAAFDRVFTKGAAVELTLRTLNAEGEYVPIHGIWTAVNLRRGRVMGVFSLRDMPGGPPIAPQPTPRQLEVLRLLAAGCSTKKIASELSLSPATVRNHIANLLTALNVHSRLQAVVAAREAGLLDAQNQRDPTP
jgi:DNA-binding CsgD family transcriptional regulator